MSGITFPAIQEPNLVDLIGGIKRRLYLILSFAVIGILLGLAVVILLPRKYEGQTLIALDTNEQNFGSTGNTVPAANMMLPPVESIVLSQVEVLQSRDLAEIVLKDLDLEHDPQFWHRSHHPQNPDKAREKALLILTDNLDVKPVGRSLVMDVRFKHSDAAMSAKIVNRFAELYQEQQVKEKIQTAKTTAAWLQDRLEILAKKLRESAKAVEEYSAKEDLVDGAKAEVTSQQISDISTQLVAAQAEEAAIKARKSQIEQVIDNKKPIDSTTDVMQSSMVSLLKNDESALLSQLADLQSKYGPNHPKILALKAELAEVKTKQHTEIDKVTQNVDNEVLAIEAKITILQKNLQSLEDKRHREDHAAIGLRELEREADANRVLYETFLGKYKETKMLGDIQQPDTKIISIARIPVLPSGPNPILVVMAISFAGCMIGLMLAVFLEQLETTIRTPEQLQQLTGLGTLAIIPETNDIPKEHIANYMTENPYHSLTETLRNLCIRLIGRIEKKPCVITLTSCTPEESKTKIALWMAKLMAQSGLKVLLIDANLRDPKLTGYFATTSSLAVTDTLLGRTDQNILIDSSQPNLSVLTGAASPSMDIAALSVDKISQTIEKLKKTADIILIDAASFYIAEAQLFNKIADYSLFIVPWDTVPVKDISAIFRQIHADKNNVTGFVITGEPPKQSN